MTVTWRPEAEVIRKAVENTKRLGEILEPSSDQSKTHLTKQVRSTWLPTRITEQLQRWRDAKRDK